MQNKSTVTINDRVAICVKQCFPFIGKQKRVQIVNNMNAVCKNC